MLDIFTVCFFGHKYIDDFLLAETKVYEVICKLIREKNVEFLVGARAILTGLFSLPLSEQRKSMTTEIVIILW